MVNWISSWARGIIMAVIVATIIEMILPEGKNKKYVKLVINIYVLFSIITPIISTVKGKEIEFDNSLYEKYFNNSYQNNSNVITQNNNSNIEKLYEENIKNDIREKLKNKGYGITEISIVIQLNEKNYGNIEKINLEIFKEKEDTSENVNLITINKVEINDKKAEKKETKNKINNSEIKEIKQFLSETYNVSEKNIQIM